MYAYNMYLHVMYYNIIVSLGRGQNSTRVVVHIAVTTCPIHTFIRIYIYYHHYCYY